MVVFVEEDEEGEEGERNDAGVCCGVEDLLEEGGDAGCGGKDGIDGGADD